MQRDPGLEGGKDDGSVGQQRAMVVYGRATGPRFGAGRKVMAGKQKGSGSEGRKGAVPAGGTGGVPALGRGGTEGPNPHVPRGLLRQRQPSSSPGISEVLAEGVGEDLGHLWQKSSREGPGGD